MTDAKISRKISTAGLKHLNVKFIIGVEGQLIFKENHPI